MEIFKLLGTIAIDASQAYSVMDDTSEKANTFSANVGNAFKRITATAAMVFSIQKVKDFATACVDAYASIAAEESAFTQIMGDYATSAQHKLDEVAEKTGVTSTRMLPYMTTMTSKFKGLGYEVDEATTLASEGLVLAADAAAFWDRSLDDSMSHLNSFLNGSYEGGEAIGLFANDTQMAMYAIEKGFVTTKEAWSQLDEATKQTARMQYAKDAFSNSGITGQAEKEAASYANQIQNLEDLWTRFKAIIGQPILEEVVLPIVTKMTEFLQWCQDNPEVLEKVFGALGEAVGNFSETLFDGAISLFKWIVENEGALTGVLTAIGLAFAGIAVSTHPILSALAAIVGFVMWLAGNDQTERAMALEGATADTHTVKTAGKYGHWTDAQKEAANDYITAVAIDDWTWRDNSAQKMLDLGLNQDEVDGFTSDLETAISEGDYWVTIQETWFAENTEANLQTELDGMDLEATVSMNPDYSALQAYIDSGGTTFAADGSHANGLDRVPFDGYRAILHKDEAVLTRAQASAWRGGGMDTSRLEAKLDSLLAVMSQVVANTGRNQTVVLDSGALVGQIAPQMDAQLGLFVNRKRRRNS